LNIDASLKTFDLLQVTPEQSLALVEYIAHLSVEDWNGIARDLRKLGFVPAGMPPAIILVSCSCFHTLSAARLQASSSLQKVLLHAFCMANHAQISAILLLNDMCCNWWLPVMAKRQLLLTGATAFCTRVLCIRLYETVLVEHH